MYRTNNALHMNRSSFANIPFSLVWVQTNVSRICLAFQSCITRLIMTALMRGRSHPQVSRGRRCEKKRVKFLATMSMNSWEAAGQDKVPRDTLTSGASFFSSFYNARAFARARACGYGCVCVCVCEGGVSALLLTNRDKRVKKTRLTKK